MNNINVVGSPFFEDQHSSNISPLPPNRRGVVSEDEADALQLYELLQDDNGIVSASKLNQLVKQYFALETEFASRGVGAPRLGGGSAGKTASRPPLPPLSTTNSFSFKSTGSASLNDATLPGVGGGAILTGSRPSTSEYLTRGVSERHTSSASKHRRPPSSRVSSAVALPSSQTTATLAKELSGPQLLSFLLTTRYALAAGVRRTRRQANLEQRNGPSSLGDYLTGGDIQASMKRRTERDAEGTRRDVRAMIFAQKKIEVENHHHTGGGNSKHHSRLNDVDDVKKPALISKSPYNDAVPPTALMRFCDVFANNDISDEDELIDDCETGFLSELYTGQGPTLVAAPHARLLPPLFPGVSAESRQRRRRHLQSTLNGSPNQQAPFGSGGGRSGSSAVDFRLTRGEDGQYNDDEEDDGEEDSTEDSLDDAVDGGSLNATTAVAGGGTTAPFQDLQKSSHLFSTLNSKKSKKYARRKSQIDASVMKSFIAELELEFNDLVEEYEMSNGGGGGPAATAATSATVDKRLETTGGAATVSSSTKHNKVSVNSRRSSTEQHQPTFGFQQPASLDNGSPRGGGGARRNSSSKLSLANNIISSSAVMGGHNGGRSTTPTAAGSRQTLSPSHLSASVVSNSFGGGAESGFGGGGRLLSAPTSSSRRGSGDTSLSAAATGGRMVNAAIPFGSMSMANSTRRPFFGEEQDGHPIGAVVPPSRTNTIKKSIFGASNRFGLSASSRAFPHTSGGGGNSIVDPLSNTTASTSSPNYKKGSTERRLKLLALEVKQIGNTLLNNPFGDDGDEEDAAPSRHPPPRTGGGGGERRSSISSINNDHHHVRSSIDHDEGGIPTNNNAGELTARGSSSKRKNGAGGVSGVVLAQLFPNRHHMQHSLQEVEDAIDNEEASPHGWQDQRRKPKSTVLFVGRSKLPRMAQHGIVLVDRKAGSLPHSSSPSSIDHTGITKQQHTPSTATATETTGRTALTLRRGGGERDPSKFRYLTPLQDRTTPLNREPPAWKKAWKLLAQNVSTHGTGRKFNLASTQRLAREVKGTGLQNLSGQRPYHLSADDKQAILQQVIRQRVYERHAAAAAATEAANTTNDGGVSAKLQVKGARSSTKRTAGPSSSVTKSGIELKASANMALTVLQGWQNNNHNSRSVASSSSPHQLPSSSPHYRHYPTLTSPQRMAEASPPSQSSGGGGIQYPSYM